MTYEEILRDYKKLFIMMVEKAGRDTGNKYYLDVEKIMEQEKYKNLEKSLLEHEPDFIIIVCSFIVYLFCGMYGVNKVETWSEELSASMLSDFYKTFLKNPTIRFCEKNGLESFEDPETSFTLIKL